MAPSTLSPDDARLAEAERIQKRGGKLFATATAMKKFNPSTKDGCDWKRFSKEFLEMVRVTGEDFVAALLSTWVTTSRWRQNTLKLR